MAGPAKPDDRLRLFVGIGLPERVAAEAVARTASLRVRHPDARWVRAENLHLTLAFLGSVPSRQEPWVEDRLREAAATTSAFTTTLAGVGGFPSMNGARVIWLGLDDQARRSAELARAVREGLSPTFPMESRPFTPHITVARSSRALDLRSTDEQPPTEEPFAVDRIVVFRSHLGRSGPRYEELATVPLLGS